MSMSYFLIILAIILLVVGIIGCIVPGVPGTPLCWLSLLLIFFVNKNVYSVKFLVITLLVCILVELANNFIPAIFAEKFGGTKAGGRGAIAGVFVGLLTGNPLAIIAGPFIGAFVGEFLQNSDDVHAALKSALFSFLGFITGTGIRLIVSVIFATFFVKGLISGFA